MKTGYLYIILFLFFGNCTTRIKEIKNIDNLYDYDVEAKITQLGIELQSPKVPPGINIELATKVGNLVYLSGNGPIDVNGSKTTGKVGVGLTTEQGYQAARLTAINHLSVLKEKIGDLNKVVRIVKVFGMVNCNESFTDHPKVINGYSDLFIQVFGERGRHARSAVGMTSLPWNLACEIEAIVEVRD
ncbi:MAG: RidA family protein [Saprospiraceae bacterium]|jgi:enamine deaminase RidA (YjgF/YER057c/UK114 family)|nr:RidA family protein [Saprospiraceae bacterium]MBL0024286.1 RidA family protein [Saprospiraceae bacterium]